MDIMERDPRAKSEAADTTPVIRFGPGGEFERPFYANPHAPGRLTERVDDGRRDALIEKKGMLKGVLRWLGDQQVEIANKLILVEGQIDAIDRGRKAVEE